MHKHDVNCKYGPAFLGIGAQKAGTTWLWENMRGHPNLWMPLVKELHWFDTQYASGTKHYQHRRGWRRYRPLLRQPTWPDAVWIRKFYSALQDGGDYLELFQRKRARLPGEITPAYAILDQTAVQAAHDLLPRDCLIIFCMRDPVERLWSGIRMYCRKHNMALSEMGEAEIDALAQQPMHHLRSDYRRTLENWSVFGSRVGLFFYEDMLSQPAHFLQHIFQFLGVDATWQSPRLNRVSNPGGGSSRAVPDDLRQRWRERYAPIVEAVRLEVGRVPDRWKE